MTTSSADKPRAFSLDDLVALNQELAALVRARIPLEKGLTLIAADLPGRLGGFTSRLAERTERGESLADAFADEREGLPEVYRAVVAAGLRSGQLAVALEAMTATARRMAELRRVAGYALIYPTIVALLVWIQFGFFVVKLLPPYFAWDVEAHPIARSLMSIRGSVWIWGPLVPAVGLSFVARWWIVSRRATSLEHGRSPRGFGWIRAIGRMTWYGRAATLAEVLALLVEQKVPLPEAMRLAGDASGDPEMQAAGREMSALVDQGMTLPEAAQKTVGWPPLVNWVLHASRSPAELARCARHVAQAYGRRAEHLLFWARLYVPVLLTLVLGASVTLVYALVVVIPWLDLLHKLAAA